MTPAEMTQSREKRAQRANRQAVEADIKARSRSKSARRKWRKKTRREAAAGLMLMLGDASYWGYGAGSAANLPIC
jgi:hypothetical protein